MSKRVFNMPPAEKFFGANGLTQETASDGTVLMVDTTTGAYQEPDGTWYAEDGTPLSYYDPTTGNYVEESDPSSTLYDAGGNPVNPGAATQAASTAIKSGSNTPASSSPSFWSSLLGLANTAAGATKPAASTGGAISPQYKPSVSTNNTGGLIVAVLVIGAVITASVVIIRKTKKK